MPGGRRLALSEPGLAGLDRRYRLMRRVPGRSCEHIPGSDYGLTAADCLYLITPALGSGLDLTLEDVLGTTTTPRP